MTEQHPITPPPPELVQHLADGPGTWLEKIVNAYRAGADQELEACCEWLIANDNPRWAVALQEGRRPKPPSLVKEALSELNLTADFNGAELSRTQVDLIRAALERLQELENNV